jgi:hypothetical protein
MFENHSSEASRKDRVAPFLISNSQVIAGSLGRIQIAKRTFNLIGRCSVSIASCILVFIVAMSSSAWLSAQTSGSISGHVADATGAVIPDANVTLKNVGTGTERSTVTTGSGDYLFPDVPPGVYNIEATHQGFKAAESKNVQLQVQQSLRQDFTLPIGQITETVTVEATGALLQVENATLGTVIENAAVNELPLNGRNYLSLVALSSNVNTLAPASGQASARMGTERATQSISVGGQRIMWDY